MHETIQLAQVTDLHPLIGGASLVAFDVGFDGQLYLVLALKTTDYRHISGPNAPSFAKIKGDGGQRYRVMALYEGQVTLDVLIEHDPYNVHFVQPMPGGQLLLACARCRYHGPDRYDFNGRLYNSQGILVREFSLGDGIEHIQTTPSGQIWVGYFDEGVIGNYGWREPVGASGLVCFDGVGKKLYAFEAPDPLGPIIDCYAMNVIDDDDVWLCYYTDFPLVHLKNGEVRHRGSFVSGSHALAVWADMILFASGYGDHGRFHLFNVYRDVVPRHFSFEDEQGRLIERPDVRARGESVYMLWDGALYHVSIPMLVGSSDVRSS